MPGFIDTHIHAPQWPNAGLGLDLPLQDWLNTYTFPLESKYKDLDFSKKVYEDLVTNLINNGTTTSVYFGSIYQDSNLLLADICNEKHQRGFIGHVSMDDKDNNPEYYRDKSAQDSLNKYESFINKLLKSNEKYSIKQTPVITPRFSPSCSLESLKGLGELAKKYNLPIQSHCSESDWENSYSINKYGKRDAQLLYENNLLTSKSIMAHGTLLNNSDFNIFHKTGTTVSHCPISNAYFGNAIFPVNDALRKNVNLGLGSDVSGGFSPSLYDNMKDAILSSQHLQNGVDNSVVSEIRGVTNSKITSKQAFYLATVGGAKVVNLKTGKLKEGYLADLQIVENQPNPFQKNDKQDILDNLIYHTRANDIKKVYVQGYLAKRG
ncbi:amidohydrolase family protein [Lactobacillus sp. S2-2]|uniref:amidohydrolase family protein n=1 Tax=Lactobacillus sp. S2-2 TaxID=2692917 RepID=UPI001F168AF7|nr:amidohydrolase family protein [Lactobacillus sp. S2-2]